MELNNKITNWTYISVSVVVAITYVFYTYFTMGMSASYFSSSYPSWQHYSLLALIPIIPFLFYFGFKKIQENKTIGWLYAFIPVLWVFAVISIQLLLR